MRKLLNELRTENNLLEFFKRRKNPPKNFKNIVDEFNVSSEYAKKEDELADYIYKRFKKAYWVSFAGYKKNGNAYLELRAAFPKVDTDTSLGFDMKIAGTLLLYKYSIGKSNPKGKVEIDIFDSVKEYKLKVDSSSTTNNELYYIQRQLLKLQKDFNNEDVVMSYLNNTESNENKNTNKLRTENTIKGVTLTEIKRMQQLAGIITEVKDTKKWTPKIQKDFDKWRKSDNVVKNSDGTYSTQDAQWRNKLKDLEELKQYFTKEFVD